jgi:hypothetical protein
MTSGSDGLHPVVHSYRHNNSHASLGESIPPDIAMSTEPHGWKPTTISAPIQQVTVPSCAILYKTMNNHGESDKTKTTNELSTSNLSTWPDRDRAFFWILFVFFFFWKPPYYMVHLVLIRKCPVCFHHIKIKELLKYWCKICLKLRKFP